MFFFIVFQASTGKKLFGKKYRRFHGTQKFDAAHSFNETIIVLWHFFEILTGGFQGLLGQRRFRGQILNFDINLILTLETYPTLSKLNLSILGAKNRVIFFRVSKNSKVDV